jgi:acyl carrier protein
VTGELTRDVAGPARPACQATGVLLVASTTPLEPSELTGGELAAYADLPHGPRRREWLTARRALRQALARLGRPADTSAYRFPSRAASLSHSAGASVAAVAVGGPGAVAGVGVDIELDRAARPGIAPFFLQGAELSWIAGIPGRLQPAALLRLWTVKEALFKADPVNAVTTLRDYAIADASYQGTAIRAGVAGAPALDFRYISIALPRGFLSVALALTRKGGTDQMHIDGFDRLAGHISSLISVPVARLTPDTTIAELVPDSFTLVEVAVDLQEEYDVVLSQEDFRDLRNLGDLAALLRDQQSAQRH